MRQLLLNRGAMVRRSRSVLTAVTGYQPPEKQQRCGDHNDGSHAKYIKFPKWKHPFTLATHESCQFNRRWLA